MILQKLMKKPLLAIGILFMLIFLMQTGLLKKFFVRDNLIPTSCKAVLVMLDKRIPATWSTSCNQNNLEVEIKIEVPKLKNENDLQPFFYRELANNLIFISKNSPNDSLERVDMIHVKQASGQLEVNALTEGKYLAKFVGLTDSKFIMEHLQATVKVKETRK